MHFEEVARRITDANGSSKTGSRIRYTINAATEYAIKAGLIKRQGDFLWHPEMIVPAIRDRSNLPSSSRKLEFISPEEMQLAVKKVVENSIAIQPDFAVPFVAKLFGYLRVTEDMKKEIVQRIDEALTKGILKQDNEYLKLASSAAI